MTKKHPTLKEVAELAGVSRTAVSMCMNGKGAKYGIPESTVERVLDAIRKTGFVPNPHAKAIASSRTFLIGIMLSNSLEDSFWLPILSALESKLSSAGYHCILSVTGGNAELQKQTLRYMENLGVEGLALDAVPGTGPEMAEFASALPCVTLNSRINGIPGACNDDFAGGKAAAEFLLRHGHRKIAFIGTECSRRAEGCSAAIGKYRLRPAFFESPEAFMKHHSGFTAAVCPTDYLLLELYQLAAKKGIAIPEELSVTGYDNLDFTKFLSPRPVTVNQYKHEVGTAAAEMLIRMIDSGSCSTPDTVFLPRVIGNGSVKAIRA